MHRRMVSCIPGPLPTRGREHCPFTCNSTKHLQELANTLYNMKDLVSMKTLLKQIPFVEDPDTEIEELTKQKEEAIKQQQEMFAMGYNNPPDEDEPEEPEEKKEPKEPKEPKEAAGDKE